VTINPPTLIQRPFANATSAKEMTKFGNIDVMRTTRDSAATRSRNIHITQVKKASAVGWKLDSQYETIEKSRDIKTGDVRGQEYSREYLVHTQVGKPNQKV
jgi:hypothetical protein